jgi:hypothetical protein
METKALVPSAQSDMNITVPSYTGKQLILTLRIVYAAGIEASGYEWVRFVYERD